MIISLKMPPRLVRWLLFVVLFFGSCSFYYWPVMESKIPGRFDGAPTDNSGPYLTDEEEQNAAAIVRESGVVEQINNGQDWEADFQVSRRANSLAGTRGVRVEVVWKDPVDSAGPWALVHCGGTRKVVHKQPWSQITRLVTWVDLEGRSVVGYGVTSEPEDIPQPTMGPTNWVSWLKVYDVESGDLLMVAPPFLIPTNWVLCPPGTYYRD